MTAHLSGCKVFCKSSRSIRGLLLYINSFVQVTSDIPDHHFMKQQAEAGGRDIDTTARGLGATPAVPTASCGEENILMLNDT